MAQRVTRTASFDLSLDPDRAIELFTAEGERSWIPGWEPEYPEDRAIHDAVGTVFIRRDPAGDQTFVVIANEPLLRRYTRHTEGFTTGIIEVSCEPFGSGTRVTVTFDMTALSAEGAAWLDELDADYEGTLRQWRDWIEPE
ncbi:hypothetical protein LGT39_02220 [Demequina sp. TTPB684]|uniref:hypothetical protein n=1 Tax=unclassified Demequina TaxID=2620311 RepID=UPI001CF14C71|nr:MULTISPECIES: hypothetical protein [unclassified Demequina]MCB2411662.1 hypothetical protein [Demequina sp. TTPB684]UPU88038.1 hypothetical protein LGT36_012435 [Demequina sp. TMPB413]